MRLTKSQLKRIIREEKFRILNEGPNRSPSGGDLYVNLTDDQDGALNALETAIMECVAAGCTQDDMRDTFEAAAHHAQARAGTGKDQAKGIPPLHQLVLDGE